MTGPADLVQFMVMTVVVGIADEIGGKYKCSSPQSLKATFN
ncbi:hypothetical protein SNOG_14652 [Parastagonospora nodorum SN15]|uniref:Uncharacterized protein n=1 Tax=Phaeosphaeria nodorum (strain SN15 / ATCC MYA-4574 / FGSC 10173) TaxID=321614 RepID=Q0U0E1_PHANO|nr:hypothetical protein SNOG_14652 [Parastagonospora nodorum SN15]EAT77844.1 hypothetical protein SNOG_14652 [Parastagonospora nodorum SN15]